MEESVVNVTFGNNTRTSFSISKRRILDIGCGKSDIVHDYYPDSEVTGIDKKWGWDALKGLPPGEWDVLFANHIIEHLHDPDLFLENCKKVMGKNTVLDIGTPNLTAWFNRALFLFGYVPHSYELSYRKGYGRAFDWNKEEMGGHLRVFTVDALLDMLKDHGFEIIGCVGEKSYFPCNFIIRFVDFLMTKASPKMASMFRVKCRLVS